MADNLNPDELRKVAQAFGEIYKSVSDGSRSFGDYADAASQAADVVEKSGEATKAALKQFGEQVGQSAIAFGKALSTGGEGTVNYGTAV
jgi:hypothetical protein